MERKQLDTNFFDPAYMEVLTATLSAHGPAAFSEDGSATLHGDGLSGMTTAGPKAGCCRIA
jgi:hypothetical protein